MNDPTKESNVSTLAEQRGPIQRDFPKAIPKARFASNGLGVRFLTDSCQILSTRLVRVGLVVRRVPSLGLLASDSFAFLRLLRSFFYRDL